METISWSFGDQVLEVISLLCGGSGEKSTICFGLCYRRWLWCLTEAGSTRTLTWIFIQKSPVVPVSFSPVVFVVAVFLAFLLCSFRVLLSLMATLWKSWRAVGGI